MQSALYFAKAISGIHCGIGRGDKDIDLPTARDAVTGYPIIPGSSIKGVLRDKFVSDAGTDKGKEERCMAIFGPDTNNPSEFASSLSCGDARTLCLAVRSLKGTFAYLTSPLALESFVQENKIFGSTRFDGLKFPTLPDGPTFSAAITNTSALPPNTKEQTLLLEDLDLAIDPDRTAATAWAVKLAEILDPVGPAFNCDIFIPRFAIVSNQVFDFLCETSLPVAAHNAIHEDTGIVRKGALWYEEYLSAESILYGFFHASDTRSARCRLSANDVLKEIKTINGILQFGGKATTGKGLIAMGFPT